MRSGSSGRGSSSKPSQDSGKKQGPVKNKRGVVVLKWATEEKRKRILASEDDNYWKENPDQLEDELSDFIQLYGISARP